MRKGTFRGPSCLCDYVPVSPTVDVTREIIKNAAMAVPIVRRVRLARPRAGVRFTGEDAQLRRYAFQGLDALRQVIGGGLHGKSVCEIGPGDFLTSGMAMLAAGATSYTAIDRFTGDYSSVEGKEWYAGIQSAWPRAYPDLSWPQWLEADKFPEGYPDRIASLRDKVESIRDVGTFDVVCSFQVAEHVSSIEEFALSMALLVKSSGIVVHRIDFGPHGIWQSYRDPLTFLRVPEPLWRAMGSARGVSNRRRACEIEEAFRAAGLSVELTESESYPRSATKLTRLSARYRQMPLESVLTHTAVLVARRAA
jgi:Methyltransferase domain